MSHIHAPVRCCGYPLFRVCLSASSALSGAVPAIPFRQYLRMGYREAARRRCRPIGALLHAVLPLCLGGGSNYCCIARTGATSDIPASTMVNGQWSMFNVQCL